MGGSILRGYFDSLPGLNVKKYNMTYITDKMCKTI